MPHSGRSVNSTQYKQTQNEVGGSPAGVMESKQIWWKIKCRNSSGRLKPAPPKHKDQLPKDRGENPTPSRPGARWKWSAFHAIAELVEFPDHPSCARAFGLGVYRRTPFLVAHPLVQNQPK